MRNMQVRKMNCNNCHRCHTCGSPLRNVLDGEEWCDTCHTYRRYRSHGWAVSVADREPADPSPCNTATTNPHQSSAYAQNQNNKNKTHQTASR